MDQYVTVEVDGITKEYEKGVTLLQISQQHANHYDADIILAKRNGRLRELFKTVEEDSKVEFITTKDDLGYATYMRGLTFVLIKAMSKEFVDEIEKVSLEYSIGNGYYFAVDGNIIINEENCQKIKARMQQIIDNDIPFLKKSINTDDARKLFYTYRMFDKHKLFKYRRVSKANIYSLGGFEDYYYGYMPPSTGEGSE